MPDFGYHDWIDAQLRNVPLPADLLARLSASGPDQADIDAQIDAELGNVAVPAGLESRLRRIARRRQPAPLWRQVALAASLFFMLGLGAAGYFGLLVGTLGPREPQVVRQSAPPARNLEQQGIERLDLERRGTQPIAPREALAGNVVANRAQSLRDRADREETDERAGATKPTQSSVVGKLSLPTLEALSTAVKRAVSTRLREESALGAAVAPERLPDLDAFDGLTARGVLPPRVPGYDLMFQLKHSEHPFVSPAAHKSLATSQVPFTFRTASYDLAARSLRAGQLPPADEIRVEDFLAAQNYLLPPAPAGGLALHAAGSLSPLGSEGLHLLDLTVQAASQSPRAHAPTRLIVAVDVSSQIRGGARWDAVLRALARLARGMNDSDRLTLIGYAEQPHVLASNAKRLDLQALLASDTLPTPTGSANIALAIESASAAARAGQSPGATRVVLITGDRTDIDAAAAAKSNPALAQLVDAGCGWQVVRVGATDAAREWSELARVARGKVTPAASVADIYDVLLESLIGRSTTVANGATLRLIFNPQFVTGYRLLGHDSATITGAPGDALTIDFHADQTAQGLYELWLKPGANVPVVTAELRWIDPQTGQPRRITRSLGHAQLTGSFSNAPPWLQQGVVAAKAAEVLRGSYFAPTSHPVGQVLDLTRQVDPRVSQQPDFQQLVELLKQAEKLR